METFDSEKEMQRHKYTNKKNVAGKDSWLKTSSVERAWNGWDGRKAKNSRVIKPQSSCLTAQPELTSAMPSHSPENLLTLRVKMITY